MTLQEAIEQTRASASQQTGVIQANSPYVAVIIDAIAQAWDIVNKSVEQLSQQIPSVPSFVVSIKLGEYCVNARYDRDHMHLTSIVSKGFKCNIYHISLKPELIALYAHHAITEKQEVYKETIDEGDVSNSVTFSLVPINQQ